MVKACKCVATVAFQIRRLGRTLLLNFRLVPIYLTTMTIAIEMVAKTKDT